MSARGRALLWALVGCPVIGWCAAWSTNDWTQGRLGTAGGVLLLVVLPATLAAVGSAQFGRSQRWAVLAGFLAAVVCLAGFFVLVLVFLLTVPSDFFQ